MLILVAPFFNPSQSGSMKKLVLFLLLTPLYILAQNRQVKLLVDDGKYQESEWTRQIAVTANDSLAIINDFENGLRFYDLNSGLLVNRFEGHSLEGDLYFDPVQNILLTTGDRKIKVWDVARQRLLKEIRQDFHSQFMNYVYVDSRHKFIFAQHVKYDFATMKKLKTYPEYTTYFYKDNYYYIDQNQGILVRYDLYTDQELQTIPIQNYQKGTNFFFNEKIGYLFIGFSNGVMAVDITTGTNRLIEFDRSNTFSNLSICNNFDFSADFNYFIASSNQANFNVPGLKGHLVILKKDPLTDTYKEVYRDSLATNEVLTLRHSNKVLVTRNTDFELLDLDRIGQGDMLVWSKKTSAIRSPDWLKPVQSAKEGINLVLDGKQLQGSEIVESHYISLEPHNGFINHLSAAEFNALPSYSTRNTPYDPVAGKNYSPSRKFYAVEESFKNVKFYLAATNTAFVSAANTGVTYHIEFSRDEKWAAFGGSDRRVTVVDLANKKVVHALNGNSYITSICFSKDNKYIFSGSLKNEILMFDRLTGKQLRRFTGSNGAIKDLEVSDNGKLLYSIAEDGALRVWNIASGKELLDFYFDQEMNYLVFTPEGYFDKSPQFGGRIFFNIDGQPYTFDQLYEKFYRPDIVQAVFSSRDSLVKKPAASLAAVTAPPQIRIARVNDGGRGAVVGTTPAATMVSIQVTAFDKGGGIKGIRVYNNRKLIEEKMLEQPLYKDSLQLNLSLRPGPGENLVEAIGIANDFTESSPVSLKVLGKKATGSATKPNLYVVAVGINEYRNTRYSLNYCVADMESFADTLRSVTGTIFEKVEIRRISNADANRNTILSALSDISRLIQPEDVFLFYYAGHGIALDNTGQTEFYFILNPVTQMTDPENCKKNGLNGTELREKIKGISAGKQLMFIDACNSGALASNFTARGAAEENAIAKLSRATGSAVFSSTNQEQNASEFTQIRHGAFTFVLLNAFSGGASGENCQITVAGLKSYIDDQVPVVTEKYKGASQFPTTFMFGQDFPLGLRCRR